MRLLSIARLVALGLACGAASAAPMPARAAAAAGSVVTNTATASYTDGTGASYDTTSNTVSVTVAAVGAVAVGPKEQGCNPATDGFVIGQPFVKTFTITNASNFADAYTIQTATTSAGAISSIAFVDAAGNVLPASLNSTISPTVQPGATIQVQVTIGNTAGIANQTKLTIGLGVRSTSTAGANGLVSDNAQQCAIATPGAALSSPAGAGLTIQKLVNGLKTVSANGGASVVFSIAFENFGGVPATNVVVTDPVPTGLTPDVNSVQINGSTTGVVAAVNGQTLTVRLANVPPNTPETVTFTATVLAQATTGAAYVNTATVGADNVAATKTSPATVVVGTANVVYDGYIGASAPVGGASVSLVDPKTGLPVPLAAAGQSPNTGNSDPFLTGADGTYSFDLGTAQLGGTYELLISAPGYLNRKIQVVLVPDPTGTLYTVTLTALDGQPLAIAGGFTVTAGPVSLANIFGFFGNIPLFEAHPVTITKSSDRTFASGGDRIVFTLSYADTGTVPFGTTNVVDTLPPGMVYAPNTGRVDGAAVEPTVAGRVLTWTFPSLSGSHTIVYAAVILPGTEPGATLQNNVTIAAGIPNEPGQFATANANSDVLVTSGVFDARTVITGRVYLDVANTGHVHKGDVWLPNVRVYLEDGESAVTDRNGRYSFPGVSPGMHVLRVDATTLPPGIYPFDEHSYDSERSLRRLVHHLYDSGLIEDINFALAGSVQQ